MANLCENCISQLQQRKRTNGVNCWQSDNGHHHMLVTIAIHQMKYKFFPKYSATITALLCCPVLKCSGGCHRLFCALKVNSDNGQNGRSCCEHADVAVNSEMYQIASYSNASSHKIDDISLSLSLYLQHSITQCDNPSDCNCHSDTGNDSILRSNET